MARWPNRNLSIVVLALFCFGCACPGEFEQQEIEDDECVAVITTAPKNITTVEVRITSRDDAIVQVFFERETPARPAFVQFYPVTGSPVRLPINAGLTLPVNRDKQTIDWGHGFRPVKKRSRSSGLDRYRLVDDVHRDVVEIGDRSGAFRRDYVQLEIWPGNP